MPEPQPLGAPDKTWISLSSSPPLWFRLTSSDQQRYFELCDETQTLTGLCVPRDFFPSDLGFWAASELHRIIGGNDAKDLSTWKQAVESHFRGQVPTLTICLGKESDLANSPLLHFPAGKVGSRRVVTEVVLAGQTLDKRFIATETLTRWTVIFTLTFAAGAQDLQEKLDRGSDSLVAFDDSLSSIVAFNPERWETIGLSPDTVRRLAAQRNVRLQTLEAAEGARLSFRVDH
jgi:hypothetical protein